MGRRTRKFARWIKSVTVGSTQLVASSIILGILLFIVVNFYLFSSIVSLNSFFYAFMLLSILTDGLFILSHLVRRRRTRQNQSFDPNKLTIVIACYNGEDVIADTIAGAQKHVPNDQIIVVSDASTDRTAEVAYKTGVRVLVNRRNLHKVGSINAAMKYVRTPYVLILDDDTLIGDTFIPTSLLDEGYTAVAFNVMPVKEKTLINELQRFEYRVSMQVGKHLRASKGAIGNVSGAIGLYHTEDLHRQIGMHSGQFAGEDEQRTLLAHLHGRGKGVTYTDSLVLTKAPATYRELFRQRAFSWALSSQELFVLYWRVLLSHRFHYLLKIDKAYLIYLLLTDPLRILFFWTLILRPSNVAIAYSFYLVLNLIIWARLGLKDTFRAILFTPVYSLGLTVARLVAHFYWLREKAKYIWARSHRQVTQRWILAEYAVVFLVIAASWFFSVQHFMGDMDMFKKIHSAQLTSNEDSFHYDSLQTTSALPALPPGSPQFLIPVAKGDNRRAIAHKAVDLMVNEKPELYFVTNNDAKRWRIDALLESQLPAIDAFTGSSMRIGKDVVEQAIRTVAEAP